MIRCYISFKFGINWENSLYKYSYTLIMNVWSVFEWYIEGSVRICILYTVLSSGRVFKVWLNDGHQLLQR